MPVRRENGRWRYREVVSLLDGTTERISGTAPKQSNTKVAAQHALLEHIQRLQHPERPAQLVRKEVPTFKEFAEGRFMEYTEARNKPSGVLGKKSALGRHLVPFFGDMRLDEIRPLQIEDFKSLKLKSGRVFKKPNVKTKKKKKNKGLSKKTIDNHLIILRRILNVAREWEIIDRVPKIELYRPKDPGFDFLDFEEAERLLEAAKKLPPQFFLDRFAVGQGDWYRMILLALKTGMRIGELLALRWSNVRLRASNLHVCEAVTRKIVGTPKSGRSREMPLSSQGVEALREQRHLRGEYVFCDLEGAMLTREQCVKPLERALKGAKIRRITWHVLRHTFASHLVMRGVPLKAVQELLGHASIEMTMRYAHLAPAARSHAVACLDEPSPAFDDSSDRELSSTLDRELTSTISAPWQRNGKN